MQLPPVSSTSFPSTLKAIREELGLNYAEFAKMCNISPPMPERYEEQAHRYHCKPNANSFRLMDNAIKEAFISRTNDTKLLSEASVEELLLALSDKLEVRH